MSHEFESEVKDKHFLAPPWGLPGEQDAELSEYLEAQNYGPAITLLRDAVEANPEDSRLLLLLAHCRFRDAVEVMFDEQLSASQESLRLIEQAMKRGVPLEWVAPFREEVERVLAEETTVELKALAALPEGGDYSGLELETVLEAAYRLWDAEPLRAGELFLHASTRDGGSFNERVRAGLCFHQGRAFAKAEPILTEALSFDWAAAGLWNDRRITESAFTALLEQAAKREDRAEFERLWTQAVRRGKELQLPFPSVWTNQDTLLPWCVRLGALEEALEVARRMEEGRERLPRKVTEQIRQIRALAREDALPSRPT